VTNRKRVLRLMRADNLLAVRKQRFVFTTDSRHTYAVYANLAARLRLTGVNQLWVADITYVRLRETFLYLAIVMDAYSRRVVGWELGEDLRAELALNALNRALADRPIEPGIVHHSDRGVQYCSQTYVERLQAYGFVGARDRQRGTLSSARRRARPVPLTHPVLLALFGTAETHAVLLALFPKAQIANTSCKEQT
jgi:transposase InsO family protein